MKRFALLTNLRSKEDISTVFPEYKDKPLPSFKVYNTFDVFGKAEGDIFVLGLTGEEMIFNPKEAAIKILETVIFAQEERNAELFGLTSLTSSVTMRGEWLKSQERVKIHLTHGDAYAAGLTLEGLKKISFYMGKEIQEMEIAILGAYGLIGKAVSIKLADMCKKLILIGPNSSKLEHLYQNLPKGFAQVVKSVELKDINHADIVVTATSNSTALVTADILKDNQQMVLYEVSVPPNIPELTYDIIREERPNIVRIDGAMASIPGIDIIPIAGVKQGTTYACWAETIMQALEDDKTDHIGEIDLNHLEKTFLWGRKYGFLHAPFSCFGQDLPENVF